MTTIRDIQILLNECAILLGISGVDSKTIVKEKLKEIVLFLEGDFYRIVMYKIEKHYFTENGKLTIQHVVIDMLSSEIVARYQDLKNAEIWICRKLIGIPLEDKDGNK